MEGVPLAACKALNDCHINIIKCQFDRVWLNPRINSCNFPRLSPLAFLSG